MILMRQLTRPFGYNTLRCFKLLIETQKNVINTSSLLCSVINVAKPNFILNSRRLCSSPSNDAVEHCNVGTVGHIDHGKTTLTAAITKVMEKDGFCKYVPYENIDKTKEEKIRGITINATHVEYSTAKRHYAHTDCPGHADFIRNMIAGASQMDGAIVVVSAMDGQMPQTIEHLLLIKQLGVEKIVVFINKAEMVDSEVLELVEIEIRELLSNFGFDSENTPIVYGSALLALNGDQSEYGEPAIRKLMTAIDEHITTPIRDIKSPFMMAIDNAFTVTGRGTVVVGTIVKGVVKKDDNVSLMGFGRTISSRVSSVQAFKNNVQKAEAGDHVGILLRNVRVKDIHKGMVLCAEKSVQLTNHYQAEFYLLSKSEGGRSKPIRNTGYIQQLFSATWDMSCRVDLKNDKTMLMPGEHATVSLLLLQGMIINPGQKFSFRENNITVGTGIVTAALPQIHVATNKELVTVAIN